MLSFPSQNDKKIPTGRSVELEKTDPGDSKPTYFKVWPSIKFIWS